MRGKSFQTSLKNLEDSCLFIPFFQGDWAILSTLTKY